MSGLKILGVDPGLRVTGYALIEAPALKLVEAGVIRTTESLGISERLSRIYEGLSAAVEELKPDVIAIEKLYAHYKHPVTAILMGHARGVVCLVSGVKEIPLVNIASTHVKKSVTGKGHAGKFQVQKMVQHRLGLKSMPEPPDVADAMAIAMTHAFSLKLAR